MEESRNILTRGYAISKTEPVRSVGRWVAAIVGGLVALTASVLTVLTAFGVSLSPEQIMSITGLVGTIAGIVGPLVGAEVARDKATAWDPVEGAMTPVGDPDPGDPPVRG